MMHQVTFHPHDTLFFRDNRPGSAGEPMTARFPMPSVFFGALRSHYLRTGGINMGEYGQRLHPKVEEVIGEPVPEPREGSLRMLGPFLSRGSELYLPAPALLLSFPFDPRSRLRAAVPSPASDEVAWDIKDRYLRPLAVPLGERGQLVRGWLSLGHWQQLLERLAPDISLKPGDLVEAESLFEVEPRMGHRRNPRTLRPEDGQLFRADHFRFHESHGQSTGFTILVGGIKQEEDERWQGAALLGGERRQATATLHQWQSPFGTELCDRAVANLGKQGWAFLTLVSPACFKAGWHPRLEELADARLVGAAVPAPEPVAGWDLVKQRHKPLRLITPAGATYFYEGVGESAFRSLWDRYQLNQSISDHGRRAGFGAAVVGVWRSE
jgi:CRISPR type III-B/RAMP module-associated protein Cmr3